MKKFYLSIVLQIFGCGFLFSQEQTVQEFQHLIMYGQSMSTGAQSYPSLSVENVPGNFMIGDQIWIKQGNSNFKELKPLIGTIAIDYQNQLKNRASLTFGETPLLGLSNHLQLKQAGAGIKYIASSNGENGKSIEVLSKNGVSGKTKYYDEYFLKSVRSAVDIAKKKGYRISSPAIFWLQGEYNYINLLDDGTHNATSDKDGYKELLVTLKNDMQNDIMSAYGQDKKPMFITYQAGSLRNDDVCSIGLAALELSNTHEDIICSGPVYQMPHRGVHMDPNGYRWYGEMMAKVYYKTQVLKEDFKPLQPKQIYRKSPNSIGIIFHVPKPPLVFDTNLVRPLYNYGFKIKNNGETQNITDIKIEGNQVIIACGQDLTGNVEVIYGQENVIVYNKLVYKAGNLRDSDDYPSLFTYVDLDAKENGEYIYPRDNSETTLRPDYEPRDANGNLLYGKPYPLYNFGVAFSYTLEADRNSLIMPGFFPKQEILYVKKGGNGDGSSWGSPLGELADALKIAGEQNMGEIAYIKQIWVAKGTYTPLYIAGNGTNPINDKAFVLPKNVEIYGGFSGTESSLSQRDWKNNQTILSGDLNGNDGADFLNRGDNTYHVVISSGDLGNSVLDGFTIKGGNAGLHEEYCKNFFNNNPCHYVVSKKMIFTGSGGGVYLSSSSTRLNNLIISDNRAVERGAGMVIDVSSPALNNVIIKDNRIDGDRSFGGAGIYSYYSTPTLLNVTIKNNKIESINSNTQGGGILNYNSTSKLTNVIISDNIIATPANTTVTPEILSEISGFGGAIFNKESPITLINALISGNKAKTGGGVFIEKSDNSKLINVTISDNQSSDSGSALFNHSMTTEVYNSIIWGNTPVGLTLGDHEGKPKFYYSLVQNSTDTGNHNISGNTNPLLTAGYQLQPTSPLLNKGNNEYLSGINNDLKNDPRIFGDRVDLGAYEYKSEICSLGNLILENTETTYDNTPHSVAITNLPSNVTVEYKYKGTSATNYPESTQAPTNAGNYIVTATVTSNSNPGCKIILTALLNINKAPAKIISQDIFIYPYDGSIKNVTAALNHTETSLVYESPQGYINAGGYTVIIKSKETTNYSAASKEVTLTITPIDFPSSINFTLEGKTTIYNGTPQGLEAFGNFPSGTILVYEYERISPTISSKETEKPTNAGKYLVTATIINPNYNTLSLTNYLTINKAQSIIQAENTQTFTYDGSTKNISATLNHNEAQLTYNPQQGYVNAGTYSIIISAPETTNYLGVTKSEAVTLNILKASSFPNTVKFEDAAVTYDGNAHNLQVIGLPQGTDVTYENNSQTTTGTYTVKATLNNPNYEIVQLTATLTINKAQSVIKADDTQTFTYDESIKYISAKLNHNEAQLTYSPQQGYVNAGTYPITLSVPETTNYLGATKVVTLNILKANSFPGVKFENATVTYDGNAHSLQVTELPQGTDVTYENNSQVNAGNHTVKVTLIHPDYGTVQLERTLTINKAQSVIQAENTQTFTYDGSIKNISATLNHNETPLTYNPQQGYVDAGTYSITINVPETTNYLGATKEITLNILEANSFPNTVKFEGAAVTYDGNAHSLQVTELPQGTDVTYENNSQVNAGNYTVKATLIHPDYGTVQLTATLTINKAQSVILAENTQTFTYDGSIKNISATLNHNETPLTYNPQQGYVNAGIYSITVKAEETTNYLGATQVVTLTILEANSFPNTVKFENAAVTYDGNAHSLQVTELPQGTDITYENNAQVNAGIYTVKTTLIHPDYGTVQLTATLTINKAQSVIKADDTQTFTYDGSIKYISATLNHNEAPLTYNPQQGYVNAGTYSITINVPETTNYLGATKVVTLNILKANSFPGVKFENATVTYDGNVHSLQATELPQGTDVTYENNSQVNAGTYKVKATLTHADYGTVQLEKTLTINKAQSVIQAENTQTFTYDGSIKNISATLNHNEAPLTYNPQQGYVNAGTYSITINVPETTNYLGATKVVTLNILKANSFPGVKFENATVTYDGNAHSLQVTELPQGTDVTYENNSQVTAGIYTVKATLTHADYGIVQLTATLTINKAQSIIQADDTQTFTYDGSTKNISATLNHNEAPLTYNPQQGYVNAGTYSITVKAEETTNYLGATQVVTLTILEANSFPSTIKFESTTVTYDGNAHSLQVTELPQGTDVTYENNSQVNAGIYTVKATLTHADYGTVQLTATLTINKAQSVIQAEDTQTFTYDGSTKNISATLNHNEAPLTYNPQQGYVNAGTYSITISVPETTNYLGATQVVTLTILEANSFPSTIKFESTTVTYDGNAHSLQVTELPQGTDVTYENNSQVNAGIYTVKATLTHADYGTVQLTATLTINKAQSVIQAEGTQTFTYDGSIKNISATLNHNETQLTYSPQQGYINAGTYSITISVPETTNYFGATQVVTLNVLEANSFPSTVKFENAAVTYDGNAHSLQVTELPQGTDVTYENNAQVNAGIYTVKATLTHADYGTVQLTATLTINKAQSVIQAEDTQTFTYDGSTKNISATLNHNEAPLTYSPQQGYVNAGIYSITVKAEETTNYLGATQVVTLTILEANSFPSTVKFENAAVTYDGNAHSLQVTELPQGTDVTYENNSQVNAGIYTVKATLTHADYGIIQLTATLTINKAQSVIQADDTQTFTYDGSIKNISATLNHNEAPLTYDPQQGYINAGIYSITINVPETTNYLGATQVVTLNVLGANSFPSTVKFESTTVTYDGNAHSLQVIGLPQGTDVTYENNSQVNAGIYTVKVTLTHADYGTVQLTATLTINKAQSVILAENTQTFTYDGSIKNISATLNHNEAPLTYNPQQGYINAGIYSITVKAEETTNYLGATQVVTLTILEANSFPSTVKFENAAITYDGNAHSLQVTELPQGTDVTYENNAQVNAGIYTVKATLTHADYGTVQLTATLTINKAQSVILAENTQTFTYDGAVKNISATLNHNETPLTYNPQQGYVNAGIYSITIEAEETTNYLGATQVVTLTILEANSFPNTVKFENAAVTYDGNAHSLQVIGLPQGTDVTYENNAQVNAGIYTVKATLIHPDYGTVQLTATLTINKAQSVIKADDTQTFTYDGSTKYISAKLNHNEAQLTYSPQQGYVNAGTYSITVKAEETTNFLAVSKTVKLIIDDGYSGNIMVRELIVAPNPVSTVLKVFFSEPIDSEEPVKIFDLTGRLIMEEKVMPKETIKEIDFRGCYSGTYILKFKNKSIKIIKD